MANSTILRFENSLGTDKRDIELEKGDVKNEKVLVEASAAGNLEKISELLSSCVLVDAVEYNKCLYYASKNYMTPLQLAAANGHGDCLNILINHGANVNAKDRFGVTALHLAAEKGYFVCVKILLDAGANCCFPTKYFKSGCNKAVPYLRGTTPLHLAATNNHVDCCEVLIDFGADYNAIDEDGRTSLFIAAQAGFRACVLTHLRPGICCNILSLPDFRTNSTPLHFVVSYEMLDCVHELLKFGSDINAIDESGHSPLHIALMIDDDGMSRCYEVSEMLILEGYNTDINLPDSKGYTPLHYVCFNSVNLRWRKRSQLAKILITYGANMNIRNLFRDSLLQSELECFEANCDILTYMVRGMLYLPRLGDLKSSANELYDVPSYTGIVDPNVGNVSSEVFLAASQFALCNPNTREQRMSAFEALQGRAFPIYDIIRERYRPNPQDAINIVYIKKLLWYEQMASSPRALKHCCRFAIRKAMGCRRLKHVGKLPIPPLLESYVLLQID